MEQPNTVGPNEHLARYLTRHGHFRPSTNSVRHYAFEPPSNLRLSVFRIDGLGCDEVWGIGQSSVVDAMETPSRTLHGIADTVASMFQERNLFVEPDYTPPRHADITGWPEESSERKLIALELAAEATLIRRSQA